MRSIIKYARSGAARFISHLDMQRAFARAFRRAKLPVKYSEGFNPHILTSFASPLSVGVGTLGDYLEVRMEEECSGETIKNRLNEILPADIQIVSAGALEENCPKLMAISHSALYELVFSQKPEETDAFMASTSIVLQDKKGRTLDIRPLVYGLSAKGNTVTARLANSSAGALNPGVLAAALSPGKVKITRIECFCMVKGEVIPFHKLGK